MSRMSSFRGQWSQAPVIYTSEFETPEDGQYRVVIEDVKYSETDRDNNPTVPTFTYILRVKEGKYAGMHFRKFTTIRTDKNLSFLKGDLTRLGLVVPADPEEIAAVFQGARGLTIDVTVKSREYQGKTYKDCTIDRLIKDSSTSNPNDNPFVQEGRPAQYRQQPQHPQGYDPSLALNGFSSYGSGGYPDDMPF